MMPSFSSILPYVAVALLGFTSTSVKADEDNIGVDARPTFEIAERPWKTNTSNTIRQNIDAIPQARTGQRALQALAIGPYTNITSNQLSNSTFFAPLQPAFDVLHFAGVRPYNQPSFSTLYTTDFKAYWNAATQLLTLPYFQRIADLPEGDSFLETALTDSNYVVLGQGKAQRIHINKNGDDVRIIFRWNEHSTYYARIVESDIISRNGVLHLIDNLVTVPTTLHDTFFYAGERNIYQILEFSGIIRDLHNTTGTFFAPINAALEGTLQDYVKGTKSIATIRTELATLLKKHTIPEVLYSNQLLSQTYNTLNGSISVSVNTNGTITVGGARVVGPNVITKNGVVHFVSAIAASA